MQEPRQLYGLGSLVKKITKPIKKVVKSPIGKAALAGAALYGLGGAKFLGGKGILAGGQGMSRFGNLLNLFRAKGIGGAAQDKRGILSGLFFDKEGAFSPGRAAFSTFGLGASLLPFFMGGEEPEEVVEESFDVTPSTIQNIVAQARRRDPSLRFLPQTQFAQPGFFTAAEGGIAELPKVRMLEGGVPEIDYRQSGGFVPMGKKEKADDVPAMLSKNEFVMTADAVRGMGDGNVEKGAQRMYDQMRQLENRVV
jgi:hypothetical protein